MDTDLIYNRGIDLPGFASYPLLSNPGHKNILREYYSNLVDLAREQSVGVILDSITWAANRDRGAELGYTTADLKKFNIDAIELIANVRSEEDDLPTVLCGQVGPRGDGYVPSDLMTTQEAEDYHSAQIEVYSNTEADLASASTICYAEEAAGVVRAAQRLDMPVTISFTVETDGRLPTGMPVREAIEQVDAESGESALYFLINCAHPDHFTSIFDDEPWMQRLRGVVANASRCSHAELEVAKELDDGDPQELGIQVGGLRKRFPHFNILGGCCGSDLRHMKHIIQEAKTAAYKIEMSNNSRNHNVYFPHGRKPQTLHSVPIIPLLSLTIDLFVDHIKSHKKGGVLMKLSNQIRPISYLKAHAAEIVRNLSKQQEPLVITQNGKAKVVIQDIDSYEQTQQTIALLKILSLGVRQIEESKVLPAEDVIRRLRERREDR